MAVLHAFSAPFLDEGKEQRLVAVSCVFQKCDAFFPFIVSNLCIITGVPPVIPVHHGRMSTLVRAAIL